jgi:SAM-dependent methyltransferase
MRSGAAVQAGGRPADYYCCPRPDVAALVPPTARRVLDVGCGAGALGALLRRRGHVVAGVELVPEAADLARQVLDHVAVADVEADGFPFADSSFDAVVLADVLEHLIDPWRVLRDAARLLAPRGVVVASVPNVQNWDVVWRLLRGRWGYRERGLLDRGHLRFFTLRSLRALFADAGLEVVRVGHNYRRSVWRSLLCGLTLGAARAFLTRQYLIVARRADAGLVG